jgi:hypothetical protein
MGVAGGAASKAVYAEIIFVTCAMRTAYADLLMDCLSTPSTLMAWKYGPQQQCMELDSGHD